MGDHQLPARLRRGHSALRARLGPLQLAHDLRPGAPHVRPWLPHLRPGAEPAFAGRRPYRPGGRRRLGTSPRERFGGEATPAGTAWYGPGPDRLQRGDRGRRRSRRGGFRGEPRRLAGALLWDAVSDAPPDLRSLVRATGHRAYGRALVRSARRSLVRAYRWTFSVRDHPRSGSGVRLADFVGQLHRVCPRGGSFFVADHERYPPVRVARSLQELGVRSGRGGGVLHHAYER